MFNEEKYVQFVARQFYGLYTTIWVKKEIASEFQDINSHFLPKPNSQNKGLCMAFSFRFYDQFYCIINSQFTQGASLKQKNQEYMEIIEKITFLKNIKIPDHE